MIIKLDPLKTQYGAEGLIHHLYEKPDENESIVAVQGSGDRIQNDYMMSKLALCPEAVLHVKLSPGPNEKMDDNRWNRARDVISGEFGIDPALATIVQHTKKGRTHWHLVFPAFDMVSNKKVNIFRYKMRCQKLAKILEKEFKHEPTPLGYYGREHVSEMLKNEGNTELADELLASEIAKGRSFSNADAQKAKRFGYDASTLKQQFTEALERSDGEKAYQAALKEIGFELRLIKGKRERYELHCIDQPKFKLSATKFIDISKAELTRKLRGQDHGPIQQKTREQEAVIKAETKAGSPESVGSRDQGTTETGRSEGYRNQTVSSDQGATRQKTGRPVNGNGGVTPRTDTTPGTGRGRDITIGADTRRVGSDIGSPNTAGRSAKRTPKTTRPIITYQETHSELIKRLKRPITPADYILSTRDNNLGHSRGDLYLERPEIIATGWNGKHHPYSSSSDHEQAFYYEKRLSAKFGALSNVYFKDGAYHVTTKKGDQFKDFGDRITSPQPGQIKRQTANEIVRAAKARGWTSLTVKGSPSYKDEITIAAAMQGLRTNHELTPKGKEELSKQIEWREKHGYKMDNVIYLNYYIHNSNELGL